MKLNKVKQEPDAETDDEYDLVVEKERLENMDKPLEYVNRLTRRKTIKEKKKNEFLEKARKIFKKADDNDTGYLSKKEARALAQAMHAEHGTEYNEEEFLEYFKTTDLNHDGRLSWKEWSTRALEDAEAADYFESTDDEGK